MIVVVGGAGYIGSVVVEELVTRGHDVSVIDNCSSGHQAALPESVDFYRSDMTDSSKITFLSSRYTIDTVMHFSALARVGDSIENPRKYWQQNLIKSIDMSNHWIDAGVRKFIFSSSAAVYGEPDYLPLDEDHPKEPLNPYGRTKLAYEWYLQDLYEAEEVRSVSLRYFNAAGAGDSVGEDHNPETHLIPNLLNAVYEGHTFKLFGTDYPTRDGTCLRDFVHVKDLAEAHIRALNRIEGLESEEINLGSGTGSTVGEVIEAVRKVTGRDFSVIETDRRAGDPARLVASNEKAQKLLGWEPQRDLETIIEDAWRWKRNHPHGYGGVN